MFVLLHIAWYIPLALITRFHHGRNNVVLSNNCQKCFNAIEAKVSPAMAKNGAIVPFLIENELAIIDYEIFRKAWYGGRTKV